MIVVPSASEPNMMARCEIDLSPGTRNRPRKAPPGSTTKVKWVMTESIKIEIIASALGALEDSQDRVAVIVADRLGQPLQIGTE